MSEVAIELADGIKGLRRLEADKLVDFMTKILAGAGGRHGDGDHDAAGNGAQSTCGRRHRRSGSEAVIDQDNGSTSKAKRRMAGAVRGFATFDLESLASGDGVNGFLADSVGGHNVALEDDSAAAGDGAHGQLFVAWDAEFADNENVERQTQLAGDFKRYGNSAARQAEDDGVLRIEIAGTLIANDVRQRTAGLLTVLKNDDHPRSFPEHDCSPGGPDPQMADWNISRVVAYPKPAVPDRFPPGK